VIVLTGFMVFAVWSISRDLREISRTTNETLRTVRRDT
jgi:hypothetical protein